MRAKTKKRMRDTRRGIGNPSSNEEWRKGSGRPATVDISPGLSPGCDKAHAGLVGKTVVRAVYSVVHRKGPSTTKDTKEIS